MAPTLSLSIQSPSLNPLPHLFSLASSLTLPTISIRLLAPSESPNSQLFIVSEINTDASSSSDQLTEAKSRGQEWGGRTKLVSWIFIGANGSNGGTRISLLKTLLKLGFKLYWVQSDYALKVMHRWNARLYVHGWNGLGSFLE
ncbi:hypothetical protein H0H87_005645 [Tephrocybe sp. NHM501043]|nr:hypothetical protein H0H87_005645 [Tephrocybe sp. NHM501043]